MKKPLNLLLIEDNPDDAELLLRELQRNQFEVEWECIQTVDALQRTMGQRAWDVVICDFKLPHFSAPEALKWIRQKGMDIPFIIVSGTIGEELAVDLMRAGANDYIMKGNLKRLTEVVHREIRDAHVRKEREEMETVIRAQQERFQIILDHAPLLIVLLDKKGQGQWANRHCQTLLGWSADEIKGKPLGREWGIEDTPSAQTSDSGSAWRSVLWKDLVLFTAEQVRLDTSWTYVRLSDGSLLGIGIDISERRRTEEQRLALEEQLRQSQKLESIGRLAGGVAHDFNNMLAVILGYAEMMQAQLYEGHPHRENLQHILEATNRSCDLTRQLLAFARKQRLEIQQVSLNEVIRGFLKMIGRTLRENIKVQTRLAEDLGPMGGDLRQLEQILMNLAMNAQDAMPTGGCLQITTSNVRLDANFHESDAVPGTKPYIKLAVGDTGTGMDDKTRHMIFDPFFTTKSQGKGTGLGLSTVYGIVKQHEGQIEVRTTVGQGTIFELYFPRRADLARAVAVEAVVPETLEGEETILVLEDQKQVRSFICEILRQYHYTVLEAESGLGAIKAAEQYPQPVQLLISDVILPDMASPSVADSLRKQYSELRVLYMSGYAETVIAHHGVMLSDVHFIQKPFSILTFMKKVREVLSQPPK